MSIEEIEKKFIDFQLQEPPYTIEEIHYLINKNREETDKLSVEEVEHYLEETKEKASLQKNINEKKSRRKASMLITEMNELITNLKTIMQDIKDDDQGNNKTLVQAVKEIRLTIMDVARLAGELQKQQDANISNYYIPINKMEDYFQERLKKFLEKKGEKKEPPTTENSEITTN